ncbi:MAG TPA: hypothetical protein VFQ24_10510 [Terriglobia bacterium]|nr:hypothetical protein [Terriglobia bacterium]
MRKPFKILVWMVVSLVALIIIGFLVQSGVEDHQLKLAQAGVEEARQQAQLQGQVNASTVHLVRLYIGEVAAATLNSCYADGYPDPFANLSRRMVAKCDHIMKVLKEYEAQAAAEEARKDAAYDKAHPLKK